jgi:hypothetical protein
LSYIAAHEDPARANDLALTDAFRQIPPVRWLGFFGVIALIAAASSSSSMAATASDPAFLGIGMDDSPPFCSINSITPASPAQDAGLQWGDAVYAMDGVALAGSSPCTSLTNLIVAHRPGEPVALDVRRGTQRLTIKATLSTRAEVLARRFVGEPMLRTDLEDLDDDTLSYDLGGRRGKTTIVGWFMLDRCSGCARVFDKIADGVRARLRHKDNAPAVLAVTAPAPRDKLHSVRKSFTANVSLAVAEPDVFDTLALKDSLRISFMVIDCRGVVRHVAPIAPDADDYDAAIDDILAAAEQAEHQRTRRN